MKTVSKPTKTVSELVDLIHATEAGCFFYGGTPDAVFEVSYAHILGGLRVLVKAGGLVQGHEFMYPLSGVDGLKLARLLHTTQAAAEAVRGRA